MKNTTINRKVIKKIATALGELNAHVVYVGGAVVSLYVNDPAADDVRPTKDLDISMTIASLAELEKLREKLMQKGFKQTSDNNIVCRFNYEDVKVDVMSTRPIGWAPANEWFEPGFKFLQQAEVEEEKISILSLPYFLATKFSAYHNRGGSDPRTSHDFEDIIYILDNTTDLVEQMKKATGAVKEYLEREFSLLLRDEKMQEAIEGNLFHETRKQRLEIIIQKLKQIIACKN